MFSTPPFTASSWAALAATRFLLAFIVCISHLHWFTDTFPGALGVVLGLGGRAAVLGFLLISGVSIGHSYAERPEGYYLRRFLRIYPLYFAAVCFSAWLVFALPAPYNLPAAVLPPTKWEACAANFLLLQGFVAITIPYNKPLWSLSFEVFYYFLTPFLSKLNGKWIIFLILISMCLFLLPPTHLLFGYGAARYAWPWLTGFLFTRKGQQTNAFVLVLVGVAVTALNRVDTPAALSWLTFAAAAAATLFAGKFYLPKSIRSIFNFLGDLSYPFYLFHAPLCLAFFHYAGIREAWTLLTLCLLASVAANFILDRWLKDVFWKPVLRKILRTP